MYRLIVIDDEYIVVEGIKAMIGRQKLDYEVVGWADLISSENISLIL